MSEEAFFAKRNRRYQYAETRSRIHRVIREGGRAFKVENCNLDDVAMLRLVDEMPTSGKPRCRWCFAGYEDPTTPEEAQAAETPPEEMPARAKGVPLVQSTRRLALAALVAALIAGGGLGALLAPKPIDASGSADLVDDLRGRVDALTIDVRVLSLDLDAHAHAIASAGAPIVVVVPAPATTPQGGAEASTGPVPSPVASAALGAVPDAQGATSTTTHESTTIVIVPGVAPAPQAIPPAPTPAPTPIPVPTCFRPGIAGGVNDRCRWPPDGS